MLYPILLELPVNPTIIQYLKIHPVTIVNPKQSLKTIRQQLMYVNIKNCVQLYVQMGKRLDVKL